MKYTSSAVFGFQKPDMFFAQQPDSRAVRLRVLCQCLDLVPKTQLGICGVLVHNLAKDQWAEWEVG